VVQWPAALCAAVGASLIVLAWIGRFRPFSQTASTTETKTVSLNFQWAQKLPLRKPISGSPGFGLVGGITFAILAMLMMLLTSPLTPKGLWVHLLKPAAFPEKSDSWTEPLIVRLRDPGPGKYRRCM
jgi:multisubunit Na+/H+ antiporter MnhG subunit